MHTKLIYIILITCCTLNMHAVNAATFYSTGFPGSWDDPLNWSFTPGGIPGVGVPTVNDDVIIRAGTFTGIIRAGGVTHQHGGNLTIEPGAFFVVVGGGSFEFLDQGNELNISGTFTHSGDNSEFINNGTLNVTGALLLNGIEIELINRGTMNLSGNTQITGNDSRLVNEGSLDIPGSVTINGDDSRLDNEGPLNVMGSISLLGEGVELENSDTMDLSGTTNIDGLEGRLDNEGSLDISGNLTITGNNSRLRNEAELNTLSGSILNIEERLVNIGNLHIQVGASVTIDNDLEVQERSETLIDADVFIGDDLRIVGDSALVCGTANIILDVATTSQVNPIGNSTGLDQICTTVCVINDGPAGITNCGTGGFSLPVTLIRFELKENTLLWEVIEVDVSAFEVWYSPDLIEWELLKVLDSQGNGQYIYRYIINEEGYYQIRSVEAEPFLSSIIYFEASGRSPVEIFPNPLSANTNLNVRADGLKSIHIYDSKGMFIERLKPDDSDISINLAKGKYVLVIQTLLGTFTRKLVVQ